ncbi:MAG: class II aldolase/adducin family protein [Acidimicrobiales bacterium]
MTTANGRPLEEVRAAVLAAAKTMHARGLVEGTAGNVSGRVNDGTVVMTPSSLSYEAMTLADLVVVTLDGEVVSGHRSPTSEGALHLATMAAHPEVGGVVHCHAIHASMFAVARVPIPAAIDEFVVYVGGDVPVCDYHQSGSDELGKEVAAHLGDRSAALMANHGLVCVGQSVDDALRVALVVEHNAHIVWGAQLLGPVAELPDKPVRDFTGVYRFVRDNMWASG